MNKYILPVILTSCCTAVMTTLIKEFIFKDKKDISHTVLRIIAIIASAIATMLSWWILKIPEQLKECVLYFFPVYLFQEIFDLDVIKRIIKSIAKNKLKKAGVDEKDTGL